MSSSINFPLIRCFSCVFVSTSNTNALDFETETIMEIVGLVVKNCIVPTDGVLTGALKECKTDMLVKIPKIKVFISGMLIEVCTIEELTIVCTPEVHKTEEPKTVELEAALTADEPNSSIEEVEGCSLVD